MSSLRCPLCHAHAPPGWAFCPQDGTALAAPQVAPAEPAPRDGPSGGKPPAPRELESPREVAEGEVESSGETVRDDELFGVDIAIVGRKLGEYVVKRKIGSGGMGIVYEGLQPVIGRRVAIKVLRGELSESAHRRDLAREARAANAIRHRGIIDVFGFGEIPGVGQYMVMEYLDGQPLDAVIDSRGPFSPQQAIAWIDGMLGALGRRTRAG